MSAAAPTILIFDSGVGGLTVYREIAKARPDAAYVYLADDAGFAESCDQGRAFGFDGKTLIHPGQIESCNRIFAPSPEDIVQARRILEAMNDKQFRVWSNRLITVLASYYVGYGLVLLVGVA